jgi:hypothetical protein
MATQAAEERPGLHNCDSSLFSLFWPEIYSELNLVRRRNA